MRSTVLALAGMVCALAQSSPTSLDYITYLPSYNASRIAADSGGYAYVAGTNPRKPCTTTLGANPQDSLSYVTKLTPSGDSAVWTTCIPGTSAAVALDAAGSVYFAAGSTVMKLRPSDGTMIYSTTIPATLISDIVADSSGSAYVTGSANPGLATTPGAYRSTLACAAGVSPCAAGFVSKLGATGGISYATYLDVSGSGEQIAVDAQGHAWVTGTTQSTVLPFPSSPSFDSFTDAFVRKLDETASKLIVSTGVGGYFFEHMPFGAGAFGIALDFKGAAYVVGFVPDDSAPGFGPIGYLAKYDSSGNQVFLTHYAKGSSPSAIAIDPQGRIFLASGTRDSSPCGAASKLSILDADGTSLLASYLLNTGVSAMALDPHATLYVTGSTSTFLFLATLNAYVTEFPGTLAGFAGKIDFSKPGPQVQCLVNGASFDTGRNGAEPDGSVAPGEIVTVFGENLPPASDLHITFDGTPAPVLYADARQINAVVPFSETHAGASTRVLVNGGTNLIGGFNLPVAPAVPRLFTQNGQLAALNQDGSVNSTSNPASPGSVVSLFLTGAGLYNEPMMDGQLGPLVPPFPAPLLGVSARYWPTSSPGPTPGEQMEVLFFGQAPGLIAGVVQVNLRIPADAKSGVGGIIVNVGNYPTSSNPLAIQIR
jgi:uncharacterized protein (TIGR03437 family)